MKTLFSVFILCFLTSVAAKAREHAPAGHRIFGQWLSLDRNDNKKYLSVLMEEKSGRAIVYNCSRTQTEGGIELTIVVCQEGKVSEKYLNYDQNSDYFWFPQNRLRQLSIDPSGDMMSEVSGIFGIMRIDWYRVYDPMVTFVYVK